ncbi:MAG: sulfite exporter TauE/SafE family protein [Gammaproteobacteria bacterium]|nr:sulfite exporter TauE/SafE family protein [Gammaproteobacteria bacterium]
MLADLIDLSSFEILFAVIVVFIAYALKGLSGFGSGLIAIPLLAFLFPLKFIVPVLGLLSYSGTIIQSVSLRKQAAWQELLPLLPFSLIGIIIALWLLVNVDADKLTLFLGVFVVVYSIYSLLPIAELQGSRYWSIVAGAFGGFIGALFGTGGPFYVIYLKLRRLDKGQFRATIAMIFLIDGGFRVIGYAGTGLYTQQVLLVVVILLPVLLLGLYAGHHLHVKINQQNFNKVINALLLCSGAVLIVKSL